MVFYCLFYQLKTHSELYAAYVPMAYDEYLKKISTYISSSLCHLRYTFFQFSFLMSKQNHYRDGEWGDHVTLQAAADVVLKIFYIALTQKSLTVSLILAFDIAPFFMIFVVCSQDICFNIV